MRMDFLDIGKIVVTNCYAHLLRDGKEKETLIEHTDRSKKYWINIVEKKHLDKVFEEFENVYLEGFSKEAIELFEKMTVNIVVLHDFGKVNPRFQQVNMKNKCSMGEMKDNNIGKKHSIISAIFYLDYFLPKINKLESKEEKNELKNLAYIYSYIISKHHGNLDRFEKYLNSLLEESEDDLGYRAKKWLTVWKKDIMKLNESIEIIKRSQTIENMMERMKKREKKKTIYLYGMTKLVYSLLVVSDYYATSEFMSGIKMSDFGQLANYEDILNTYENMDVQKNIRKYEKEVYPLEKEKYKLEEDINILRNEMFLDAENELKKNMDESIFFLEAPTGSGKSNTAMNLSFQFVKSNVQVRKIFYIYPFNTLVEQNMNSLEKIFGGNEEIMAQIAVVNSLVPIKEKKDENDWEENNYEKILLDRQFLNYPIVLSTHIMLFRTLFGNRKEDAFGFHQLCHSVIVIDEIQSYKNSLWSEIIIFLKEFAKLLDIKIIIMSATLPNLDLLTNSSEKAINLIINREKYFNHKKFAKRVRPNYELLQGKIKKEELVDHVLKHKSGKILIEFIKKSSAEEFYELLKEYTDAPIFLMTGDSSIQERKNIIKKVEKMPYVILVATQVVEAGVDIDMDIGYKDISKLDSEEQFMGRINRSGRKSGIVYFFDMDDAARIYKNDVRNEENCVLLNEEIKEVLNTKDFPRFYAEYILPILKQKNAECNENNINKFFKEDVAGLDMAAVAKRMRLIDDDRNMISVYLAREIIGEDGKVIDGRKIWEIYKNLLQEDKMSYSEKTVKLYNLRSQMNTFIYQFNEGIELEANEQIGDIYYVEDGEEYFDENGILRRKLFESSIDLFI